MSRMVKKSKKKTRRKFSSSFKNEICSLIESGRKTSGEICREHDLYDTQVYRWLKLYREERASGLNETEIEELHRMRKELKELKKENEFLKSAAAYFAKESK